MMIDPVSPTAVTAGDATSAVEGDLDEYTGTTRIYKMLSLLLQYPDAELLAALPDLTARVAALPNDGATAALQRFLAYQQTTDLVALQQAYVRTFDFQKRLSLYLTYYQQGDRRQRGMALLQLKRRYAAAGLPLAGSELPDYLPVLLEFAALAPVPYGKELLTEFRVAIELLRLALQDARSSHAYLLDALCHGLGVLTAEQCQEMQNLATEGPPTEQVGLEPFGPPEVMPVMAHEIAP